MDDKCIICLDNTDIYVKCVQCTECQICHNCYFQMYQCSSSCPTCRTEDWEVEQINLYDIISFIKLKQSSFFFIFDFYYYYQKHIISYWDNLYD